MQTCCKLIIHGMHNQLNLILAVQHTAGPQLLPTPIPEQTKSGGLCQCPALREAYITYLRSRGKTDLKKVKI